MTERLRRIGQRRREQHVVRLEERADAPTHEVDHPDGIGIVGGGALRAHPGEQPRERLDVGGGRVRLQQRVIDVPGEVRRDVARLAPPVILIVLVVAFAVANTQDTEVDLLFKETTAPLFVVLVATAVVGALIGALLRRHRKNN